MTTPTRLVGCYGTPGRGRPQDWLAESDAWFVDHLRDPGRLFPRAMHYGDGFLATGRLAGRQVVLWITLQRLPEEGARSDSSKERRFGVWRAVQASAHDAVMHGADLVRGLVGLDWCRPSTAAFAPPAAGDRDAEPVRRLLPWLASILLDDRPRPPVLCPVGLDDPGDCHRLALLCSQFFAPADGASGRVAVLPDLPAMPDPSFFAAGWDLVLAAGTARGGAVVDWRQVSPMSEFGGVRLDVGADLSASDLERLWRTWHERPALPPERRVGLPLRWRAAPTLDEQEWGEALRRWRQGKDSAALDAAVADRGMASGRLADIAAVFADRAVGRRAAGRLAAANGVPDAELHELELVCADVDENDGGESHA